MMDTAGMGMASVIHHVTMRTALANTLLESGSNAKGLIKRTNKNKAGPLISARKDLDGRASLFISAEFV
jgi:hypothetical protein